MFSEGGRDPLSNDFLYILSRGDINLDLKMLYISIGIAPGPGVLPPPKPDMAKVAA